MTEQVRVRIAPSPIGNLHIGTARTAILNYLLARKYSGKFLVRIEDTDVGCSNPSLVEPILNALAWLGITPDEPVVYQSRLDEFYRSIADRLLGTGQAYRCFCTPAELEAERNLAMAENCPPKYSRKCLNLTAAEVKRRVDSGEKYAVRLRIPDGETEYDDMVIGPIHRKNEDIEDFVASRSDGSATSLFAGAIDDHDMQVSHIIQGYDHIANTLKQIHLYRSLGWPVPTFGHLPLLVRRNRLEGPNRLGEKDVAAYEKEGILPEAMFNFLCLLGWSTRTDQEIFTTKQLIQIFDERHLNPSDAVFDEEKLVSYNKSHIAMKSEHDLAVLVAPMLVEAGLATKYGLETRWDYLRQVIRLLKERVSRVGDFVALGGYFFSFDFKYDPQAEAQHFTPEAAELLDALASKFGVLTDFSHESLEQSLASLAGERGIKEAKLVHPTRLAVSGMSCGPCLYEVLAALGQKIVMERMKKAVDYIRAKG